jgi:hypothetical protein
VAHGDHFTALCDLHTLVTFEALLLFTWFKVLWESLESASYNGAFRALKASFGKAEKRAPNLLGPRLELLSRGHRPVESGNQTSQNPPDHLV